MKLLSLILTFFLLGITLVECTTYRDYLRQRNEERSRENREKFEEQVRESENKRELERIQRCKEYRAQESEVTCEEGKQELYKLIQETCYKIKIK
ncbi:MAG: hypothetical protein H7A23_15635 [Leptospiraceae bacterium]|nr:hypothetical protein [Leptospiraceae bacterium]MCP5495982.1 hypothetical protein [Leptospiraceae bacterium]